MSTRTSQLKKKKGNERKALRLNVYPYRRFRLLDVFRVQLGRHSAGPNHPL